MSVAMMLPTPSRASTSSSSSFAPVSRQNTMSSSTDGRSARQSKRYSVTALYLSMSANERDMEIEDDLAKGNARCFGDFWTERILTITSTKDSAGSKDKDIRTIKEKLRP
jgi:hypothetical protein